MNLRVRSKTQVAEAVVGDVYVRDTRLVFSPATGECEVRVEVVYKGAVQAVLVVNEQDLITLSASVQRARVISQGWIERSAEGG